MRTIKIKTGFFLTLLIVCCGVARADVFETLIMPGKVIEGHAEYEQQCEKCHEKLDKSTQTALCLDCHEKVEKDVSAKHGFHGRFNSARKNPCKSCHVEHMGRDADIVKLDARVFPHQFTDFPLKGAHRTLQCAVCHEKGKKHRDTASQCYQCHDDDPHEGRLGKKCTSCHNQSLWSELSFDHDQTDFKLTGRHEKLVCNSCHINNKYKDTPGDCFSCHSVDDVHRGNNGKKCARCHDSRSWTNLKFDHDRETDFNLRGRHKKLECAACHVKNPYKVKIKTDCYSCHKKDDQHLGRYGVKCQSCHGVTRWDRIRFDHDRDTQYKLAGKHKQAACIGCHQGDLYRTETPTRCYACHKPDDAHKGEAGKKCARCHSPVDWNSEVRFDHDMSTFPLTGLHAVTACDDCHGSSRFDAPSHQCLDCHKYDDVHKARFGPDCQQCHNTNGWDLWAFDHDKDTNFRLDGAHDDVHCYHCHSQPATEGIELNQSCGVCHAGDDPHDGQFGSVCEQCHDTQSFDNINMAR